MAREKTVFIVDDERAQTTMMQDYLSKFDWLHIKTFNSGEEAIKNLGEHPDVVFLDYNFELAGSPLDGIQILNKIKEQSPESEVIMMSAQDSIEVAMNTVKFGAFDYIVKNESAFSRAESSLMNILSKQKLKSEAKAYRRLMVVFAVVAVVTVVCLIILFSMDKEFHFYGKTPGE